MYIYLSKAWY